MAFDMKSIQALMGTGNSSSGLGGARSTIDTGSSSGLGGAQGSQIPVLGGMQGQIPQQGTPEWDEWLKKLLAGQGQGSRSGTWANDYDPSEQFHGNARWSTSSSGPWGT